MRDLIVEFEWHRRPGAFQLAKETAQSGALRIKHAALTGEPARERTRQRVVFQGGDLVTYRPLDLYRDILVGEFAKVTSAASALAFVDAFGPLTDLGHSPKIGDSVEWIVARATKIRSLIQEFRLSASRGARFAAEPLGKFDILLFCDPATSSAQLTVTPRNLHAAIWLLLGRALSEGASVRECEYCRSVFVSGPGSGRRRDSRFCSEEHQIAFNSEKRTKGKRR